MQPILSAGGTPPRGCDRIGTKFPTGGLGHATYDAARSGLLRGYPGVRATHASEGRVEIRGRLAIGPDGILFVGDSAGAAIYALDVNDRTAASSAGAVEVKGLNEKIAAMAARCR